MNKMEQTRQRVRYVIIKLLLITIIFSSFQKDNLDEDYEILNLILSKNRENLADYLYLKPSGNNDYLMEFINKQKDNLQSEYVNSPDTIIKSIFSFNEFTNLLAQRCDGQWDLERILDKKIKKFDVDIVNDNMSIISVSKPIYHTTRKYALVSIVTNRMAGIEIYRIENRKWVFYKLIDVKSLHSKKKIIK